MKRFFFLLFSSQIFIFSSYASNLIQGEKLTYLSKDDIKKIWETNHIPQLFMPVNNGVSIYELSYYTPWIDGSLVKATGYVFIPDGLTATPATLLYHHGTRIIKKGNTNIGANEFGICAGFAADGYIVVMPEYLGLGNGDKYQLYLHAKTESSASVDMLNAARDFVQKNYSAEIHDLYVTGYSQGGHAALATQYLLEEKYTADYKVVASAPMSGPYDMSGTLPKSFDMQYTSPALFVFMLKSYQEIYGLRHDFSEVLRKPYDSLAYVYLDGVNNYRAYNAMLPQKAVEVVTSSFFSEDMHGENSVFMQSLKENDVYRFVSKAPVQYCYCADDETVDPQNTWAAYDWMKKNGVKKVSVKNGGENLDHEECAIFALMHTKLFFDKYRYPQRSNFKNDFSTISLNLIIAAKKAFPKFNLSF